MSNFERAIEDHAYVQVIINCSVGGCLTLFEPSLDEPFTDPIDEWAKEMAKRAVDAGWAADTSGKVLCPKHRQLSNEY